MQGLLGPNIAAYAGTPYGAPVTALDIAAGTVVFDTTTGAIYLKTSARGDNTGFLPLSSAQKAFSEDFSAWDTTDQIAILTATGLVRANTANLLHHLYTPGGNILGLVNLGTQTTAPTIVASGLDIGGVATDDIGHEIFSHFAGAQGRPFIIGQDPAFFFQATVNIEDISGTDTFMIGFRRAEVNNAALANYADYIGVGFNTSANPGAIKLFGEINGAAPTSFPVDTTQTVADGIDLNVRVNVSAAGVVTFKLSTGSTEIAAPTAAGTAPTMDNGDPVIPFIHFLNTTDLAGAVIIKSWQVGYQL